VKIAWFTPLSTRSAIGEYSVHVTAALAERCEVDLWVGDDDIHRTTGLRTFEFYRDPSLLHRLGQYDLAVYNIGNNDAFHGAIYEASKERPGIVVLHDRSCHHLFAEHWLGAGDRERYLERMETLYGREGLERAEQAFRGERPPIWESDEEALRFPLVEEALVGAIGVAVHSADHAADVGRRWLGPIGELFLPAYRHDRAAPVEPPGSNGRTTLLTLGHVNRNKQVHRVLEILAADPALASRVDYQVVGPGIEEAYGRELAAFADEHGLDGVSLMGYQPEDVVERLLAEADVCVNLRSPALEGSSASLIRQLEIGKPVLALDVGGFHEVPDGAIVKVAPDDRESLARALRGLVDDAELRASVASAAAEHAARLTPARYAAEFLDLADEVASWKPVVQTVDHVADELTLLGASPQLPAIERVGRELGVLVGGVAGTAQPMLRAVGPADREALARFLERNDVPAVTRHFHPFEMTAESADEVTQHAGEDWYFGAFVRGKLVGLSMLRGWNEGFDVPSFGIVVDSEWHGQGIGSLLTDFTLDRAPWLGSERVRLSVYASNERAHRMYVSRGFQEVEREPVRRHGDPDERIVMVKELL
jgi:glycosyltransferase involved in cell wall biosynthesis/ribosomal protein S18 acetylase RimI-like enzyme